MRLLILLHSRYRKVLIIRVAKNSLSTVVCEVFLNATFQFLFFAACLWQQQLIPKRFRVALRRQVCNPLKRR
ncbi:hypothetical protein C3432_09700 [Citrobacter amalonaticus]|uniref:Uncharacterized protein n=1 Tax=Citrobacter amalonaticus TaxID=35703 RepID=A0A2S4RZU6_CITAM|nr:hypothetical protein C3432_09700 [Citrobacter amalonaticus]POT76298.1 hypothetical protein C3436_02125 [Citrobacter amalonaticus]POU66704.1 hypothetical protein C3430_07900 [Citrobacter amalonaticus]POV05533.1 hypothetical protein C3424_09430 [Citrobacter amalonaticus]